MTTMLWDMLCLHFSLLKTTTNSLRQDERAAGRKLPGNGFCQTLRFGQVAKGGDVLRGMSELWVKECFFPLRRRRANNIHAHVGVRVCISDRRACGRGGSGSRKSPGFCTLVKTIGKEMREKDGRKRGETAAA